MKVAPLKAVSIIPRLVLMGAHLGSGLTQSVVSHSKSNDILVRQCRCSLVDKKLW